MDQLQKLQNEIESLKERNSKVDANKAWETSYTRKLGVAILTYLVILIFFKIMDIPNPFISAIVPTLGFLLSTLSLKFIKEAWVKNVYAKK